MAAAPAIQHLEHWTLVTSDIERTKRFYREVLGATEPRRVGPGPECMRLGNTTIDFFPAAATGSLRQAAAGSTTPTS
jgi:catechol 2,3-dioxygenase-like lactoylglutathione lyase family enzyme